MRDGEKTMDGPELAPEVAPDLVPVEFELQLARAMLRVDAPEGFAARVMERAVDPARVRNAGPGAPRVLPGSRANVVAMRSRFGSSRVRAWAGGAIAAMLALGIFGAEQTHLRHQRAAQTALANQQFAMAVWVTDQALEQTRAQLQRAGFNLGE